MKTAIPAQILTLLFLFHCSENKSQDISSLLLPNLLKQTENPDPGATGPSGKNLANFSFDGFSRDNEPVVSCDVDNSSGQGIRVNLPTDVFAGGYYLKIETVPSTSPYLFPENGALDLWMSNSHRPAAPPSCTWTRTVNTSLRYVASISDDCILMGSHTLTRFEVDCKPD